MIGRYPEIRWHEQRREEFIQILVAGTDDRTGQEHPRKNGVVLA